MRFFRITTPSALDILEIITLGLTTKANTQKIGHKGSGLKFALAYLHRLASYLAARGPGYHLKSEVVPLNIRGIEHQIVQLKSLDSDRVWDAHISTHAGEDTWTEPWFILRELLQNAIDENGSWEVTESEELPETEGTVMQILMTPEIEAAWAQKDIWFQPRYPGIISQGRPDVKGFYFHGFLVYKGASNWKYSYDATSYLRRDQLSEDRQLRNNDLGSLFLNVAENADFDSLAPEIYQAALEKEANEDIHHLYENVYHIITHHRTAWGGERGFKLSKLIQAFKDRFGGMAAYHTTELSDNDPQLYYARSAGFTPALVPHRAGTLLSYGDVKQISQCLPTIKDRLRKVKSVDLTRREKLRSAMRITKKIQPHGLRIEVVAKTLASDTINCMALADQANNRVLLMETLLDRDIPDIAKTLVEEYVHIQSGAGDNSRQMQDALLDTIYNLLARNRKVTVANLQTA